jgi:site-specific recombinase XerC
MPFPSNLEFHQRIAKHPNGGAVFLCQRHGHKKIALTFDCESDASEFRSAHDFTHHNSLLRHTGIEPARNVPIGIALSSWMEHIRKLEIEGRRSPETTRHYERICKLLGICCRDIGVRTARDLTPERISEIARWFTKNTETEGALTVKALSALKTIVVWKGMPANWKVPRDEIRAKTKEKLDLDSETIRRIVSAMPAGSVEEAAAYLKARTGARDVEIVGTRHGGGAVKEEFDLDVEIEVDGRSVKVGIFRPILHDKGSRRQKPKRHVYVITSDAVEKIRPFVQRAKPGGFVFVGKDGQRVTHELLRAKVRAASKRAGFVKLKKDKRKKKPVKIGAIDSLAQVRAEVITIVEEEISLQKAAEHIGHDDPATTSKWYVKSRLTLRKIVEKYRPAQIIASAIPLRERDIEVVCPAGVLRGNKRKLESGKARRSSRQRALNQ